MVNQKLVLALPTGRILKEVMPLVRRAGIDSSDQRHGKRFASPYAVDSHRPGKKNTPATIIM